MARIVAQTATQLIEERLTSLAIPTEKRDLVRQSPLVQRAAQDFADSIARRAASYERQGAGMSLVAQMRDAALLDGRTMEIVKVLATGTKIIDFTWHGLESAERMLAVHSGAIQRLKDAGTMPQYAEVYLQIDGQRV